MPDGDANQVPLTLREGGKPDGNLVQARVGPLPGLVLRVLSGGELYQLGDLHFRAADETRKAVELFNSGFRWGWTPYKPHKPTLVLDRRVPISTRSLQSGQLFLPALRQGHSGCEPATL